MTSTTTTTGTITFQTVSQLALWTNMLTGQMSDGMWENSRPHEHWKFWGRLEPEVGRDPKVVTQRPWECKKVGYDFSALIPIVGDEMLRIGRMAQVKGATAAMLHAAQYMPDNLEKFREMRANGSWPYEFVKKYMDVVSDWDSEAYYAASYSGGDLRRDLRVIRAVMKTVKG